MELSETTRTIVIGVSVGVGSFALVVGIVISCLICRRKRRERKKATQQRLRYDKRSGRRYGQPGAPSAGSSSGKVYRSKHRVRAASTENPGRGGPDGYLGYAGSNHVSSQPEYRDRGRGSGAGAGGHWNSLLSGNPAPFKSNSLPGASEAFFPRYETRLANRHRDRFGYTGRTVSEPYDQQSMDAKWQDNWPGRPIPLQRAPSIDADSYRYYPDSYDSRSQNSFSLYHHRLYGGRDFTGAGFMSQSIEKSLNGLQQSTHSLYYDGRR